ncbi:MULTISPECIES: hypothetical protein [Methyloceanibacter]|uniref:Uncharacterized protein n=1 Tax=Methyloceanibacter caenitepidi TaxID=1384459 RepID=A0A0A8K2E3_9HYPH|nr:MULTISPECIES: hypothetical protein [Methyloceanibacter]BAQ16692.1 hypothetical protein GL4_1234 [Methyloceanibacter caenitepidi]
MNSTPTSEAVRLNHGCACITLDREALGRALDAEAEESGFSQRLMTAQPHAFSDVPVFLSGDEFAKMEQVVEAIEQVSGLERYRQAVLAWAPDIARRDFGPAGALMGYDFHLGEDGPSLIEINTNAGGAFLNAALGRAQMACCGNAIEYSGEHYSFEDLAFNMFLAEWGRQGRTGKPRTIAIVDDVPEQQFLFPEFTLAREALKQRGIPSVIADARRLHYGGKRLTFEGEEIDLVYNRLTDFALEWPEHQALRQAYEDGAVTLTPNPHNHALLADKRNMSVLSDSDRLESWGGAGERLARLQAVPPTVLVTSENASDLWERRKTLFFKPSSGHGSKAVYRGDKLTKRVWSEILKDQYVAQHLVRPSERLVMVDRAPEVRKIDVRLYTYQSRTLIGAARVYQGQTTNLSTPGGGFAPLFIV